jgi:excisionase family DNA binding protein
MTKPSPKAYLSRSEVARLFHVSPITVARWADQGKLPFELTLGGQRRYPREGTLAILGDIARRAREVTQNQRSGRAAGRARSGGAARC